MRTRSASLARLTATALAIGILVATAVLSASVRAPVENESAFRRVDTRAREASARIMAAGAERTDSSPVVTDPAAGWAGQSLIGTTSNDWEPVVASVPGTSNVAVLTTRYGEPACPTCPDPAVVVATSSDDGATFGPAQPICVCDGVVGQYDPQIVGAADGTLHAVWLNHRNAVAARSVDGGTTWTSPVTISAAWADKPWLVASPDGQDLHVSLHGAKDTVVTSHGGGATWGAPVPVHDQSGALFTNGGAQLADGTIVFSATRVAVVNGRLDSTQDNDIVTIRSSNGGASWHVRKVATTPPSLRCENPIECRSEGADTQTSLAARGSRVVILYATGLARTARTANTNDDNTRVIASRVSTDGGRTWDAPRRLSPAKSTSGGRVSAGTPVTVIGRDGTVHASFTDNRRGNRRWNTWYRTSDDGGRTWGRPTRISDATSGPTYVHSNGYAAPYGDYAGLTLSGSGNEVIATWGEGSSDIGPGGTWVNRTA